MRMASLKASRQAALDTILLELGGTCQSQGKQGMAVHLLLVPRLLEVDPTITLPSGEDCELENNSLEGNA